MAFFINETPEFVSSGAFFSDPTVCDTIRKTFVGLDRFGNPYQLYWEGDGGVYVPRNYAPPSDVNYQDIGIPVDFELKFTPRNSEQTRLVKESYTLLSSGRNHILQAPTGGGKTIMGTAIAAMLGRRFLVVTTKEDILHQWKSAVQMLLGLPDEQIGFWAGKQHPSPHHKVVIGLVQSILKGPKRYPGCYTGFGLAIFDESHRMSSEHFSKAMQHINAINLLGLSATPKRKDGKDAIFYGHVGQVSVKGVTETLIPKVIMKHSGWKVPRVNQYGKYQKLKHTPGKTAHLNKYFATCTVRLGVIGSFVYAAYGKGRSTLVFCDSIKELEAINKTLLAYAIPVKDIGWYIGITGDKYTGNKEERKSQRDKATVKPVVLTTYKMCSEATNLPWMDTCVLASPKADVIQIVGRIRREYEDKKQPVVFDVVDADSSVFAAYANKRKRWYNSIGAEVIVK